MTYKFGPGSRAQLVRDRKGTPRDEHEIVRSVNSPEGRHMGLVLKVYQEMSEVDRDPDDVMEYADVMEALLSLAHLHGLMLPDILAAMDDKRARSGGFDRALVWARTSTPYEETRE